jgi:hypothetical protein
VQTKIECSNNFFCLFEGTLNTTSFHKRILCDMKDLSFLETAINMMIQSSKVRIIHSPPPFKSKVLELFVKLDDYFYTTPTENRIEGNMIGLILRDWTKLYSFCFDAISYVENIMTKIDEEYCL